MIVAFGRRGGGLGGRMVGVIEGDVDDIFCPGTCKIMVDVERSLGSCLLRSRLL